MSRSGPGKQWPHIVVAIVAEQVGLVISMGTTLWMPGENQSLMADATVSNLHSGQAFNRYAYVLNNPLTLVDPSGFEPDDWPIMPGGQVRRTGRTNHLDRREAEHGRHPATKGLRFEVDKRTNSYPAQRGREQRIYEEHPEAELNRRRPIDPRNPRRKEYLREGDKL